MKTLRKGLLSVFFGLCILLTAPCILPNTAGIRTVEAAGKVSLNKTKATLQKGQKLQLKLNGAKKKISWSSSDKKVAAVTQKGLVTAKKAGSVNITAKVGKKKFVCKITVETPSISSKTLYITRGKKYPLKMKGTKQKVTWQTSDKSIAGVSSKGVVSAKKAGTATVTAKIGSKKYQCKVVVETPSLSKKTATVAPGKKLTLTMKGTKRKVTWSSGTPSVASVSSSGVVTGKKAGTAVITAQVGKMKYSCKVTVKSSKTFSVSAKSIRIPVGSKKELSFYSPTKSKMSVRVASGNSLMIDYKWGSWTKNNRRPLVITGITTGKLTLEVTENKTKKKLKVTVEVYKNGSYAEPNVTYYMDGDSKDNVNLFGVYLENNGNKPLRVYSLGAASVDPSDSYYDRDLTLASVSASGNITLHDWREIPAHGSGTLLFYTEQSTRYTRNTALGYVISYDGKYYGVACSYEESGYMPLE